MSNGERASEQEGRMIRYMLVRVGQVSREGLERYLPGNYAVTGEVETGDGACYIVSGEDSCGWTLDGYVIPRLASGLIFGREVAEVAGE